MVGTPTPTPAFGEALNMTSGYANAFDLSGVLILGIYVLVALVAAQAFLPWLARSDALTGAAQRFLQSLVYAVKGVAASITLLAIAAPAWFIMQADSGTREVALRWGGYIIGGYLFLVVVGWLADRAVAAFIDAHPDYESFSDIWPEAPDEDETPEVAD